MPAAPGPIPNRRRPPPDRWPGLWRKGRAPGRATRNGHGRLRRSVGRKGGCARRPRARPAVRWGIGPVYAQRPPALSHGVTENLVPAADAEGRAFAAPAPRPERMIFRPAAERIPARRCNHRRAESVDWIERTPCQIVLRRRRAIRPSAPRPAINIDAPAGSGTGDTRPSIKLTEFAPSR